MSELLGVQLNSQENKEKNEKREAYMKSLKAIGNAFNLIFPKGAEEKGVEDLLESEDVLAEKCREVGVDFPSIAGNMEAYDPTPQELFQGLESSQSEVLSLLMFESELSVSLVRLTYNNYSEAMVYSLYDSYIDRVALSKEKQVEYRDDLEDDFLRKRFHEDLKVVKASVDEVWEKVGLSKKGDLDDVLNKCQVFFNEYREQNLSQSVGFGVGEMVRLVQVLIQDVLNNEADDTEEVLRILDLVPSDLYKGKDSSYLSALFLAAVKKSDGSSKEEKMRYMKEHYSEHLDMLTVASYEYNSSHYFTEEDRFELFTKLKSDDDREDILSGFRLSHFSKERAKTVKLDLFDLYLNNNPQAIIEQLSKFKNEFVSIPVEMQKEVLKKYYNGSAYSPLDFELGHLYADNEEMLFFVRDILLTDAYVEEMATEELRKLFKMTKIQYIKHLIDNVTPKKVSALVRMARDKDDVAEKYIKKILTESGGEIMVAVCNSISSYDLRKMIPEESLSTVEKGLSDHEDIFQITEKDRITPLIMSLASKGCDLNFSEHSMKDFVSFVKKFKIQNAPILYNYYVNLQKLKRGEIKKLPSQQVADGIDSIEALENRFVAMRRDILNGDIRDYSEMTAFDYDVLAVETNFYTSRWAREGKSIASMHRSFCEAKKSGKIEAVPEGYSTKSFDALKTNKNFDALEYASDDFRKFSGELNSAKEIVSEVGFAEMKGEIIQLFEKEITVLENVDLSAYEDEQLASFQKRNNKKIEKLKSFVEKVKRIETLDVLLREFVILERELKIKSENSFTTPFMRQILFARVMSTHSGYDTLPESVKKGKVSERGLSYIQDICGNVLKQHVLKDEFKKYFSLADWEPSNNELKKMRRIFSLEKIKRTVGFLEGTLSGMKESIEMVPDRGFVGELSAYYSDACYTKVDPMLEKWPSLVPLKFVLNPEDKDAAKIVGAVLFIESKDADGQPVLIVRANNPQDDSLRKWQAEAFCESIFDAAAEIAKERGIKRVLVSKKAGTTSNRYKINNYIGDNYKDLAVVKLQESLAFNNLEIQDECVEVRGVLI